MTRRVEEGHVSIEGFDNIIAEAVRKRVEVSIVEGLAKDHDGLVERIVKTAMDGKIRDNYRDIPFIEKLAKDVIQEAAREAMKAWVAEAAPQIQAEIERQLGTAKFRKQAATAMLDNFIRHTKAGYSTKVSFEMQPDA